MLRKNQKLVTPVMSVFDPKNVESLSEYRVREIDTSGTVNVEDSEFVDVGGVYLVPVVLGGHESACFDGHLLPVIGPLHEDAEFIRFPWRHWHIDWRFVSHAMLEEHRVQTRDDGNKELATVLIAEAKSQTVERQAMECLRDPVAWGDRMRWFANLEAHYHRIRANCNVCPHRGMSLTGAAVDPRQPDVRICPGHGLAWDSHGRLVPRARTFPKNDFSLPRAKAGGGAKTSAGLEAGR